MTRAIFCALVSILAASAAVTCEAGAVANDIFQENQLLRKLEAAEMKSPEYQEAKHRVIECDKAVMSAMRSKDSDQLAVATAAKAAAQKELAIVAQTLEAKDAELAAMRAKIGSLRTKLDVDLKKVEAEREAAKAAGIPWRPKY
jgi:hypothetical protein